MGRRRIATDKAGHRAGSLSALMPATCRRQSKPSKSFVRRLPAAMTAASSSRLRSRGMVSESKIVMGTTDDCCTSRHRFSAGCGLAAGKLLRCPRSDPVRVSQKIGQASGLAGCPSPEFIMFDPDGRSAVFAADHGTEDH